MVPQSRKKTQEMPRLRRGGVRPDLVIEDSPRRERNPLAMDFDEASAQGFIVDLLGRPSLKRLAFIPLRDPKPRPEDKE